MLRISLSKQYALFGLLGGLIFPLVITVGQVVDTGQDFVKAHLSFGWSIWFIDTIPICAGLLAYFFGRQIENLQKYQPKHLRSEDKEAKWSSKQQISPIARRNTVILPSLIAIIGIMIGAFLFVNYKESLIESIDRQVEAKSQAVTILVKQLLEERFLALDRMASRHTASTVNMESKWRKDAANYYKNFPGFQAVEWADQRTQLKWIYPTKGNEAVIGLILNKEGKRDDAIKEALKTGEGAITKLIQLKQGGLGFRSIHPTYSDNRTSGYIIGVYRTKEIFSNLVDDQFILQIKFNDEIAFIQGADQELLSGIDSELSMRNIVLDLRFKPSKALLESSLNIKNIISLPVGIIFVFLIIAVFSFFLLRSRLQLSIALETKTRFLANMSHEIRTPMNGILGLTELLRGRSLDQDCQDKLSSIQHSGHNLLKIIDDILDFSKLEAGKVDIEIIPIDLKSELTQLVGLLEEKASENGSTVLLEVDQQISQWIYTDLTKVRQIVTNLLSNAIKFTKQGSIEIDVSKEIKSGVSFVKISVKDSGIGISKEQQNKLFLSFSQVDASTTREFGGTGLGLSICKGLVETMGGQIWVESLPEVGSTFYFTFPLKESLEAPFLGFERSDDGLNIDPKLSILVAEDNSINRSVIDGFLDRLGYSADFAVNGEEAVSMSSSKQYDLILMDCNMPVLDGFKATEKIKERSNPPRIVALTASALVENRERCEQAGMDGFLSKPISKNKLKKELAILGHGELTSSTFDVERAKPPKVFK